MPYIYEHRPEEGSLVEIFGYQDGSISIDSIQDHHGTEVKMDREEVKNLVGVLQDWLNASWGK